jgi:UDPglucose--hexose-1-phosphate uridylyltransferase
MPAPHRRYNPLTGDFILVSPQRQVRPWQGQVATAPAQAPPRHDPACYLCPGNARAGGAVNPDYSGIYVFQNDFPALLPDTPGETESGHPLLQMSFVRGENRVICFTPRHDLTLAQMEAQQVERVIRAWIQQYEELGGRYRWVQVFENRGEMMGASNPHPHGQIWAIDALPNEAAAEDRHQLEYRRIHGSSLLEDYLQIELDRKERVILESRHWVVVVPFWALWPFETLVLPRRAVPQMTGLSEGEIADLAGSLKHLLVTYDRLFDTSFPYSMGWHCAPFDERDRSHWQLHAHFYPPLLRSATVRKFMVGYELLAEAQRDLTPEEAAQRLRQAAP